MFISGETPFLDLNLIKQVLSQCKEVFPNVGYAVAHTPTYITGMMGYIVASPNKARYYCFEEISVYCGQFEVSHLLSYTTTLYFNFV